MPSRFQLPVPAHAPSPSALFDLAVSTSIWSPDLVTESSCTLAARSCSKMSASCVLTEARSCPYFRSTSGWTASFELIPPPPAFCTTPRHRARRIYELSREPARGWQPAISVHRTQFSLLVWDPEQLAYHVMPCRMHAQILFPLIWRRRGTFSGVWMGHIPFVSMLPYEACLGCRYKCESSICINVTHIRVTKEVYIKVLWEASTRKGSGVSAHQHFWGHVWPRWANAHGTSLTSPQTLQRRYYVSDHALLVGVCPRRRPCFLQWHPL